MYIIEFRQITLIDSSNSSIGPDNFFNFFQNSDEIKRKFYDIGFNLECGLYYPNKKIKQNIRFCIDNKIRFLQNILNNYDTNITTIN